MFSIVVPSPLRRTITPHAEKNWRTAVTDYRFICPNPIVNLAYSSGSFVSNTSLAEGRSDGLCEINCLDRAKTSGDSCPNACLKACMILPTLYMSKLP